MPAVRERPRSDGDTRNHAHRVPSGAMSGMAHAIALPRTLAAACQIAIAT
jgi:hypothetical protein